MWKEWNISYKIKDYLFELWLKRTINKVIQFDLIYSPRKLHQELRGFFLLNQRTAKVAQLAFSASFAKKISEIVTSVTGLPDIIPSVMG